MTRGAVLHADGRCLLSDVVRTTNVLERMRGMLFRPPLQHGSGLLLAPCASVHSVGMRYALDIAFLDRNWTVVKTIRELAPFRFAGCIAAALTLEMRSGEIDVLGLMVGDRLTWVG